jgi:hypothetical protein
MDDGSFDDDSYETEELKPKTGDNLIVKTLKNNPLTWAYGVFSKQYDYD